MSLKITSDSAYNDMLKSDQRKATTNLNEQVQNISLTEITAPEKTSNNNQIGNIKEKDKVLLANPQKQIQSEISKVNNQLRFKGTRCEFKIYDDINKVGIKVFDKETNEVVCEMPTEETIELMQKLWELAGIMYDEKA